MKKIIILIVAVIFFVGIILGVYYISSKNNMIAENTEKEAFWEDFPMNFTFSSGAGGWRSEITLNNDGTFTGTYSDSEMGEIGEGYPNGTVYVSEFSGRFEDVTNVADFEYSMKLAEIKTVKPIGEQWIEEGVRYLAAEPFGFETGKDYTLYLPHKKINELPDEFLSWWQGRYVTDMSETLPVYGIYNNGTGYGFFSEF